MHDPWAGRVAGCTHKVSVREAAATTGGLGAGSVAAGEHLAFFMIVTSLGRVLPPACITVDGYIDIVATVVRTMYVCSTYTYRMCRGCDSRWLDPELLTR